MSERRVTHDDGGDVRMMEREVQMSERRVAHDDGGDLRMMERGSADER